MDDDPRVRELIRKSVEAANNAAQHLTVARTELLAALEAHKNCQVWTGFLQNQLQEVIHTVEKLLGMAEASAQSTEY